MSPFIVVIPARMASQRLPGKPLADIGGRPMIAWVVEQARRSSAERVIVATDSDDIAEACRRIRADVAMTASDHASGTDRIAEVAASAGWSDEQIVVNVQGDEPLLPPALIDQAVGLLDADPAAGMATLMTPLADPSEYDDPNIAKVVTDQHGGALYFSRAPIPATRERGVPPSARRHIGLYAYRTACLKLLAASPVAPIEAHERLEQLRALWLGQRIAIADAVELPPRGVDTEADLEMARAAVRARSEES
ncbi:MAG: 3-deoxy-manno-octulosonate cytidylyltransferase [Gammaproteobacteria bacterium]|nr:3-deoxy-manno-octulosonate cytidylyltransferase [Gammaproteobacteria bacterium]